MMFEHIDKKELFIIPYITTSNDLFKTNCLRKVKTKRIGLYFYVIVEYSPISQKQYDWILWMLSKEDNVTSISEENKEIIAFYKVPSNKESIVTYIINGDIKNFTKSIILDNISFWKHFAFLLFE